MPRNNCLYRMYDKNDVLLYIGISTQVMARLHSHWSSKEWICEVENIYIERFQTKRDLEEAETKAIKEEKPKYNIALNQIKIRPEVKEKRRRQRRAFSSALIDFVESKNKSWIEVSYELGICKTAISRWKNARVAPNRQMLKVIEEWSDGEICAEDFVVSNF